MSWKVSWPQNKKLMFTHFAGMGGSKHLGTNHSVKGANKLSHGKSPPFIDWLETWTLFSNIDHPQKSQEQWVGGVGVGGVGGVGVGAGAGAGAGVVVVVVVLLLLLLLLLPTPAPTPATTTSPQQCQPTHFPFGTHHLGMVLNFLYQCRGRSHVLLPTPWSDHPFLMLMEENQFPSSLISGQIIIFHHL